MTLSLRTLRLRHILKQAAILAALGIAITPAQSAEELTDRQRIEDGRTLAAQWCAHCHAVSPQSNGTVQADVPSFGFIAQKAGQTRQSVEDAILAPHPPMPDLRLSRDTVSNLALYILSLREEGRE